ncbi:MAG TPA: sulfur carrier protein ThiS [Microbacterium sp.]|uniref:sulfur carrier protein ThiS n=1 Tax=Microbacterium sp. TaxID=51671 RepID=UPI002B45F16A|nr:sulfur carrier protein ThiS [Microbacterium sp.]HKT56302.1 sulfur carrier protein ThiS [Microbacterium sp.]
MITITVNGERQTLGSRRSITDLVEDRTGIRVTAEGTIAGGGTLGIAVAVNSAVVPRTAWAEHALAEGDLVELVTATQGG